MFYFTTKGMLAVYLNKPKKLANLPLLVWRATRIGAEYSPARCLRLCLIRLGLVTA
jgi:hypothetical protein